MAVPPLRTYNLLRWLGSKSVNGGHSARRFVRTFGDGRMASSQVLNAKALSLCFCKSWALTFFGHPRDWWMQLSGRYPQAEACREALKKGS